MKRSTKLTRGTEVTAGLERIKSLEKQYANAAVSSRARRMLSMAIRIEAEAYRKSLDAEQATATHDARPHAAVGVASVARPVARHHT